MNLKAFYLGLPDDAQARFAEMAGYKVTTLRTHILNRYRTPGPHHMAGLVKACQHFRPDDDPTTVRAEVLMFFHPEPVAQTEAAS